MLEDFDASKTKAPVTRFTQSKISPCDEEFHMKRAKQNPGPG